MVGYGRPKRVKMALVGKETWASVCALARKGSLLIDYDRRNHRGALTPQPNSSTGYQKL